MEPRLSLVTLGVADLGRAIRFYGEALRLPRINDHPEIAFFELGRTWLALISREALAADAGVPAGGSGFPGFTLAHNLRSREEVDSLFDEVRAGGARIVKEPHATDWGGYSGYFADPDGYLWEAAYNPDFPHV